MTGSDRDKQLRELEKQLSGALADSQMALRNMMKAIDPTMRDFWREQYDEYNLEVDRIMAAIRTIDDIRKE